MNSFGDVMRNLDWSVPVQMLLSVIPALLCITLHELSHGFVAYKLGDNTAKNMGRLTLNPIKHLDIFGLLMMVVFKFGWAKPVPVNMRNFKHPKRGMALTALAGPVANVIICCVFLFIYGFIYIPCTAAGGFWSEILNMVQVTAYLSIAFAVFNLIPVPPLDGSKVLFSLLDDEKYYKLMYYERYGMLILFGLIATDILANPLRIATQLAYGVLFPFARWGLSLSQLLFY